MKKWGIFVGIMGAVLFITFLLGFYQGRGGTLVKVMVQNHSSHPIATARIEHDKGSASTTDIGRKSSKRALFYTGSETSYRLIVHFDNNRTLRSDERRVRPGTMVREIVTDSVIVLLE